MIYVKRDVQRWETYDTCIALFVVGHAAPPGGSCTGHLAAASTDRSDSANGDNIERHLVVNIMQEVCSGVNVIL